MSSPETNVTNSERESRKYSVNGTSDQNGNSSKQTTSTHENYSGPIEGIERALAFPSEIPDDHRKLSSKKKPKKKKKSIVKGSQNMIQVENDEDHYRDESKTFFEKPRDAKQGGSNASSVFEIPAHLNMDSRLGSMGGGPG